MIHEDRLHEVECPACGSDEIIIHRWTDDEGYRERAKAICECGFTAEDSWSARQRMQALPHAWFLSPIPFELAHNGKRGEEWNAEPRFSPRKFLEQHADDEAVDGGTR